MDLFVSDLDGTLLDPDARLDPQVRDRLNALIAGGLPFTVASARSAHSMRSILNGLDLRLPVVGLNGGWITRLAEPKPLVAYALDRDVAGAIGRAGLEGGVSPIYSNLQGVDRWVWVGASDLNGGQRWYRRDREAAGDSRLRDAPADARLPRGEILSVTFIAREAALVPIRDVVARLDPTLQIHLFPNAYSPGWHWLSVYPADATKAGALRWIADRHGVEMGRVTVFGDALNDLSMFRAAGRSVAVANAHPELAAAADERIGPHHEHSVVDYLERAARSG